MKDRADLTPEQSRRDTVLSHNVSLQRSRTALGGGDPQPAAFARVIRKNFIGFVPYAEMILFACRSQQTDRGKILAQYFKTLTLFQ